MFKKLNAEPGIENWMWDFCPHLKNWNYRNSCGNFWRLYYSRGAEAVLEYGGEAVAMRPDTVALIPPMTRFSTSSKGVFAHFYIHFSTSAWFNRVRKNIYSVKTPFIGSIDRIVDPAVPREVKQLLLLRLLSDALLSIPPDAFTLPEKDRVPDSRAANAVTFMRDHLDKPLTNRRISRHAGVSVNTLNRIFVRQYDMPPQQFHRLLRVEEAQRRLQMTDDSIEQVAAETGFADRYHFSKVFKQTLMITPASCRKNRFRG